MADYKNKLQSNNMILKSNNLDLQFLINQANSLPDADGVELPTLSNPAIESEVFLNKEIIDEQGNVKTGTFTIENELSSQSDLIAQLQNAVDGLPEAGGSEEINEFIAGEITSCTNSQVTKIGSYAFCNYDNLTSVSFPAATYIGSSAFSGCNNLTSVCFPVASYIENDTFRYCTELASVNFPAVSYIGSYAFDHCRNLASISFPVVSYIGSGAFGYCSSLASVSFPVASYIGSYAFHNCSSLASANFPVVSSIGVAAFRACASLTSISFPVASYIESDAFCYCYRLSSFQLGASSVCRLPKSNAFSSTPFTGYSSYFSGTPHIYVPESLITAYQSATNWTYFSSYFSSIESLLISFTIDGDEYQAIEGMTWGEWADSKYNTNVLDADLTAYGEATNPLQGMKEQEDGTWVSTPVTRSDYISKNFSYTLFDFGWN